MVNLPRVAAVLRGSVRFTSNEERIRLSIRTSGALIGALAAAVVLAACGSSSKTSSHTTSNAASTTSTSASTTAAPAGAAIKIGMICSCSGPQAANLASVPKIANAWISQVNAAGGINGHPVALSIKDDASNPASSLQAAKALVQQDHVVGIVADMSLVDSVWANYVASAGVPVIGGISAEAPFLTNPSFYPSGSQLLLQTYGQFALARGAGKKKMGVMYCAESPVCAQLVPLTQGIGKLVGIGVTTTKISSTAPTYAAPCLQMKSAGVDALAVVENAPVVKRVVDSCAQQGYTPGQVNVSSTSSSLWLKDKNFDGMLLSGSNANPYDTSLAAVKDMHTALDKYAPGFTSSDQFSYVTAIEWPAFELFQAAAKAAQLTPSSTAASLKKGLYALKNETLGGWASPLNFSPGKPAFVPCYFGQQIKNGTFGSLNGNKPTCLAATQAAALAQSLKG
jgi:branched-chain amino acid transport system substrate-binding protein